uniref:sensor domain-containing diguanylate cyclase n=1 Tax=Halomonas sp. TaxID=1486246 RepID=UPI00260E3EC5|nr:sensor domain-containing diguanylate cyclase [Halomonas sp.]
MSSFEPETNENQELSIELPVRFVHELSAAVSLFDLLKTVARWSQTVFLAHRASITLVESDTHLKLIAMEGKEAIPMDQLLPIEGTMAGRVFLTRQAEYMADFSMTRDLDCMQLYEMGLKCCLDVPLISGNQCFGTMNVAHEDTNAFTLRDRLRMQAMAHWLAACIRIHHQVEEVMALSETDPLTGVFNRRAFSSRFASIAKRWQSEEVSLGVALIDLDHFKVVNDTYGHEAGDKVLVQVGELLAKSCRKTDLIARMGGEEFCVIMVDVNENGIMAMLNRFLDTLSKMSVSFADTHISVTASVGALLIDGAPRDLDFLIGQADRAMYRAKNAGRNRIEFTHIY